MPKLKNPLFIAAFEGWGNALNVSEGMASFLIRKLDAKCFATVNSDLFYRYDNSLPFVDIKERLLKEISHPGGAFYVAEARSCRRDIVVNDTPSPEARHDHRNRHEGYASTDGFNIRCCRHNRQEWQAVCMRIVVRM